jgi:hypothetical protein
MRNVIITTLVILLIATGVAIAAPRPGPLLEELRDRDSKTPVIIIPGLTGSKLRDKATGKTIWGDTGNFFGPRDGGRSLALPIAAPPAPGEVVEAFEIVEEIVLLGVYREKIYGPLIDVLVQNGYVRGNLLDPRPGDTALVYPYDWRYGNLEAARQLPTLLEKLRRVRGEDTLHVIFICHSNAARIARWLVKYGDVSLEAAEAGQVDRADHVVVDKIIFAGTAQGGSLSTFRVLDRGRAYVPMGRKLQPEYMFTLAGLYEALPAYQDDLFLDTQGRPLPVNLFAPANWPRYGWSIFGPEARKRVARIDHDDPVLGTVDDRMAWLTERLATAQRIQTMLMSDVPEFPPTRYYQVQGAVMPTAAKAVLVEDGKGRWEALTLHDKRVFKNEDLASLASSPGDRHATRESQEWLSPQERDAVTGADFSIDVVHRSIFKSPEARQRILEFLLD